MATRILDEVKDDKFIPSNIDTRSPVVFCWDNNDISEETATGAGTTHCTNGIVIQRPLPVAMQPAAKLDTVPRLRRHQRSLDASHIAVAAEKPPYVAGVREGPQLTGSIYSPVTEVHMERPRELDLLYIILRSFQGQSQLGQSDDIPQQLPHGLHSMPPFAAHLNRVLLATYRLFHLHLQTQQHVSGSATLLLNR